ncbi:MAG: hypothetical protein N3I35_00375 [Clostridia bacterium]|nr:hypothetical protein [Clostridia bacterium]
MLRFIKKVFLFFDLVINHGINPFTVLRNRKPLKEYTEKSGKIPPTNFDYNKNEENMN